MNARLQNPIYRRKEKAKVYAAVQELGVTVPQSFMDFYLEFEGPFAAGSSGYQLQDIVEDSFSVLESTLIARKSFKLPARFIVLTELTGGAVLILDSQSGKVFDVDFEGGLELLLLDSLKPRWMCFEDFLAEFFS